MTAEAATRLAGSDRAEALLWGAFGAPGWLYCAWRHATRVKVCAACGGESLVREARAATARFGDPEPGEPIVHSGRGALRWPRALRTPRERLRRGGVGAALFATAALAHGLGASDLAAAAAPALCAWAAFELARVARERAPACEAWDEAGRSLSIQLL